MAEIKVGVGYKIDGVKTNIYPGSISDLAKVEVEYKTLPGWQASTTNVREFQQLPRQAQAYVRFIEKELQVPVRWVGVGKGRERFLDFPYTYQDLL